MAAKTATNSRDVAAELAYLTRALKAPTLRGAIEQLADRARTKTWSYEEFLAACLQREVSARESHGGKDASGPPASHRASRWRSSTSTTPAVSNATP
ncbi:putative transposase [Mycobacterium tuberculosis]|nr:putative transposase [Mycobacterium tuberculosis]